MGKTHLSYPMNSQLDRHFKSLTMATQTLLKEVGLLSSSTYDYIPGNGRWSISHILTHLLTSERLSLNYMKKKSQAPVAILDTVGLTDDVRFFLLKLSQHLPVRYKAPKVVLENTPAPLSFDGLVRDWEILRTEMHDFLQEIDPGKIDKKIYKHPIAGRLSAVHAVKFMTLHLNHHRSQIMAIISKQRDDKHPVA